jgi:hypothetical protein
MSSSDEISCFEWKDVWACSDNHASVLE